MAILVDKNTRVLVCGMTGREGGFHTQQMIDYGTAVVGGVTPGKGGTEHLGVPVFDTVEEAVKATQANASIIFGNYWWRIQYRNGIRGHNPVRVICAEPTTPGPPAGRAVRADHSDAHGSGCAAGI